MHGRKNIADSFFRQADRSGFTIIEILVVIFVIGTVVVGLFGLFLLSLRTAQGNESRIIAIALANERMEMVRNLPYAYVGTVGGIPSGSLPPEEVIERNNVPYTVKTNIVYVDDPFDGLGEDDPINTDYKQVRVEVTWPHPTQTSPILLISIVAPPGVEGGEVAGTLALQIFDADGAPVPGATISLVNPQVNPPVDYQTQTNSEGRFVIPGLKESVEGYELQVSKEGYTTKKTLNKTDDFFPNTEHTHLTALPGVMTEKTFSIDRVSQLLFRFVDEDGSEIPDIEYRLRGSKTIGTDSSENLVYAFDVASISDNNGLASHDNLQWDNYHLTISGATTGYDIKESNAVLPVSLNANETKEVVVTLVPHTPISLHMTVTSLGSPVENATVTITKNGIQEQLVTGAFGQVFFAGLPEEGTYNIEIAAEGYVTSVDMAEVAGTQKEAIELIAD